MKIIPFGVPLYEKFPAKLRKRLHGPWFGTVCHGRIYLRMSATKAETRLFRGSCAETAASVSGSWLRGLREDVDSEISQDS